MKLRFTILFSLLFTYSIFAQNSSKEQSLVFHSNFEEQVLKSPLGNKGEDYLKLFLATSPQNDSNALKYIQLELTTLFEQLEKKKFGRKSTAKTKTTLEEELNASFLKKYDAFASFEQLFKTGTYNDVTRTALSILVFEHFKLPSFIQHDRHHIYPVFIKDGTKKAVFETSSKGEKEQAQFESDYWELLKNLKIISEEEARQKEENLFAKHYMPTKNRINPNQLAGNLYYFEALNYYEKKDYIATLNRLQKAQLLYPLPRNMVILQACLFQLAKRVDYTRLDGTKGLFRLHETFPMPEVKSEILRSFNKIADYQIIQKKNPAAFEKHYQLFLQKLSPDANILSKIDRIYFVKTAQYYARNNKRDSLVKYVDLLYQQWPSEKAVQIVLAGFLMETLQQTVDFKVGIQELNNYIQKYSFLEFEKAVQDRRLFFHSLKVRHFFESEEITPALQAMATFENLLSKYGRVERINLWMTTVYTSAATYYFQQGNYTKAREITAKALMLMPDSEYFAHRQEVLQRY